MKVTRSPTLDLKIVKDPKYMINVEDIINIMRCIQALIFMREYMQNKANDQEFQTVLGNVTGVIKVNRLDIKVIERSTILQHRYDQILRSLDDLVVRSAKKEYYKKPLLAHEMSSDGTPFSIREILFAFYLNVDDQLNFMKGLKRKFRRFGISISMIVDIIYGILNPMVIFLKTDKDEHKSEYDMHHVLSVFSNWIPEFEKKNVAFFTSS